jgi:succinate-acetate transporter protein
MPEPAVMMASPADPTAVGLVAFGLTTVLLSLINVGILPPGGESVVIPLGLAFGGLTQILAGVFEFSLAHTFGMTAFLSYGAFWWWFALLLLFSQNHLIDISGAGATVGVALLLWGLLTLYLWISTFRQSKVTFLIFLTLWVSLGLLGLGAIEHNAALTHAGGWFGLASGCLALYGSFGIVTNATFGRAIVPLGVTPVLP